MWNIMEKHFCFLVGDIFLFPESLWTQNYSWNWALALCVALLPRRVIKDGSISPMNGSFTQGVQMEQIRGGRGGGIWFSLKSHSHGAQSKTLWKASPSVYLNNANVKPNQGGAPPPQRTNRGTVAGPSTRWHSMPLSFHLQFYTAQGSPQLLSSLTIWAFYFFPSILRALLWEPELWDTVWRWR